MKADIYRGPARFKSGQHSASHVHRRRQPAMALPMLVGGADCGPINPLQGLSKELDRDRGLQQVGVVC